MDPRTPHHRPPRPPAGTTPAGPSWTTAVGLGLFALVRPLARITGVADSLPLAALVLTLVVTAVWVLVVGLGRSRRPVLTLTLAGLVYAVATIPLSAVLSTLIDGELSGPLANPVAIVPLLALNAGWGALAGVLAAGVRRMRGEPS